jgi:flagellar biosynthesis/type III secretory pathway M-ring protein FliF/YscJ
VVLLLIVAAVVFLMRRASKRARAQASAQAALPAPASKEVAGVSDEELRKQMEAKLAEQAALKEKITNEALNALKVPQVSTKKAEVLTKHLTEIAKKDPAGMAHLVRTWLNEVEQ